MTTGPGDGPFESRVVVLSPDCRTLRLALRPLVWVALEEVALDAVAEDGRLVARTSARRVAERLGVDPGTAARALGELRARGLVGLKRETGPAGRFGLSVYELGLVTGLSVIEPRMATPCAGKPNMVSPDVDGPGEDRPDRTTSGTGAGSGTAAVIIRAGSHTRPGQHTASASLQCPGQETLDFGSGSS